MKKFWMIYTIKNPGTLPRFDSLEDAVSEAKRLQSLNSNDQYVILESVQCTVRPIPNIEMQELK